MSNDEHDATAEPPHPERPTQCDFCSGDRVWWNGTRTRTATVLAEGKSDYRSSVLCPRVKCADCRRSWALRPTGVLPHKHIQPDVVAAAMSTFLFDEKRSQADVARAFEVSERTMGRWTAWIAALATPQRLLRALLAASDAVVVPEIPEVRGSVRKARSPERAGLLESAAHVLCLLESLACALGLAPPGLQSVLERAIGHRSGVCTYAAPALPASVSFIPEGAA